MVNESCHTPRLISLRFNLEPLGEASGPQSAVWGLTEFSRMNTVRLNGVKPKSAFLAGCLVGYIISSAFHIWIGVENRGPMSINVHSLSKLGHKGLNAYLASLGNLGSPINKELGKPWRLATEYNVKKTLFSAVFTSRRSLEATADILNETWGSGMTDYRIFFGGDSDFPSEWRRFPFMQLQHEQEFSSPQPTVRQLFSLVKFLHSKYIESYNWFLLASHKVYVSIRDLENLLNRLDPYAPVYLGKPGSSNPEEMVDLRLIPNEYFCEGGPGIILSRAALEAIVPFLDECLQQVQSYRDKEGSGGEMEFGRADVELGRCFSRKLGVQCSTSRETISYFIHDANGESIHPEQLWYKPEFQHLLTLYPITKVAHMRSVHHFCKVREFEWYRRQLQASNRVTNQVCSTLPREFSAPATEMAARDCNSSAFHACHTLPNITHNDLPPPFTPTNKYELVPWETIHSKEIYISGGLAPVQDIRGDRKHELDYVTKKAIDHINEHEVVPFKLHRIDSGYIRYSSTRGREYILDLSLYGQQDVVKRRINLVRPHMPQVVVLPDSGLDRKGIWINFVVPLSQVGKRFSEFMKAYESICLMNGENVRLVLATYGKDDVISVRKSVQEYQEKYPGAEFRVVHGEGQFSRGRALNLGLSVLNRNELAFLCDVDMTFDLPFLNRCRLNTIQGRRVYYPEFFKYYNMDYVYRFKRKPLTYTIKREHGHWATYSYGMLCIYKSDYTAVGGFDTSIVGWGGEDVELFLKILRHKLEVLKAPDYGLTHRYHDKVCSTTLQPLQFSNCIKSRNEGLADRMQLAEYILYLEDVHHLTQRTLWNR